MKEQNSKKHYGAIDGLRAFSAVGIILMHVLTNGGYTLANHVAERVILSFTDLVFLFMVISGFAMCCGYYNKVVENRITVGEFYSKRYAKIWPFFALLCALDLVIEPSKEALYEVFANLTLCFGLLPNADISVIGVGWFLGLIFAFYLVFPFFCYLLSDKRRAWFSFAAALVFHILCETYFRANRTNLVYSAVFFLAGGLIYLYRDVLETAAEKYHWAILLACIGLLLCFYTIVPYVPVLLALFALILIATLGIKKRGILQNPVTKFLSGISMELYLCHMVIFRVLEKLGVTHLFASDELSYLVTAVGTIVGACIFALAAQKGIKMAEKAIKQRGPQAA